MALSDGASSADLKFLRSAKISSILKLVLGQKDKILDDVSAAESCPTIICKKSGSLGHLKCNCENLQLSYFRDIFSQKNYHILKRLNILISNNSFDPNLQHQKLMKANYKLILLPKQI